MKLLQNIAAGATGALLVVLLIAANTPGARLASGKIFVGDASNIAQPVTLSGDVTVSNTGVTTIGANSLGTSEISANTIVSADIDQNFMQVSNTQLTNAQILALRATPIQLIAAPAANVGIIVHKVCVVMDAAAGAYTESADDLAIEFASSTDIVNIDMTDGFDDAAVTVRCYIPSSEAQAIPLSAAGTACDTTCGGLGCIAGLDSDGNANGAAFLACNSASSDSCLCRGYKTPVAATKVQAINTGNGEWGGGNAANTLSIRIWYSLVPTIAFSSGG